IEPPELEERGDKGIPLSEVKRVKNEVRTDRCASNSTERCQGKNDAWPKTRLAPPANCTSREKDWPEEGRLLMQIQESGSEHRDKDEAQDCKLAERDEA